MQSVTLGGICLDSFTCCHTETEAAVEICSVTDRLFGPVVKAYASRIEDPGFESRLRRDFSGVESYQ